jgi:Amt family ammonium transporter
MIITWIRYGKPDVSMTLNGTLGGLVAITAGCDAVSAIGAFLIGIISSFVLVFGIEFIDQKLKVDDPVGAIGVHGLCGAAGTVLTGLFALDGGLFYGGGAAMITTQVIGVAAAAVWTGGTMLAVFAAIKAAVGLRVSRDEEMEGLDIREHALASSYADFMPSTAEAFSFIRARAAEADEKNASPERPVILKDTTDGHNGHKMSKLEIYADPNKLEALTDALYGIGITGLTMTPVSGWATQPKSGFYRGAKMEAPLQPKVRVETVVSRLPVKTVVDAVKSVLHTGEHGDGKIFIYDVENVIRISSGEEGFDALQYSYERTSHEAAS